MKAISSILLLSILFFCGAANATCTQADSAGMWHTYANGGFSSGSYTYLAYSICSGNINSTGYVLSGSKCINSINQTAALTGRLLVGSNCKVTGSTKVGSVTYTIKEAWMDRAKNTISGIITIPGGSFTFQAVRQ